MTMNVSSHKKIASKIMKVGTHRVWIDPTRLSQVSDALTREDLRTLISEGVISVHQKKGTSRHRARERHIKRTKGHRRGYGNRRGTKNARLPAKRRWINLVRPMRELIRHLRDVGKLTPTDYRYLYRHIKGNMFRNKAHLKLYLREHNMIVEPSPEPAPVTPKEVE